MDCSTSGFPVHHQLPKLGQTHVHRVSDAIQPSHPLSSPSLPAFNLSQHHGLFQWVSSCIRWPKYWSFSFSISPSNEYSGLISFRIDWFDLFAVQGTLKSLLQQHNSKASILQCSAFFVVQLSHLYMTTGKTIALTNQTLRMDWFDLTLQSSIVLIENNEVWMLLLYPLQAINSDSLILLGRNKLKKTILYVYRWRIHSKCLNKILFTLFWPTLRRKCITIPIQKRGYKHGI